MSRIIVPSRRIWARQPRQLVGISPEFGNAVSWIPGDVRSQEEVRLSPGVTSLGVSRVGSEAPSGVALDSASYVNFPEKKGYFGQKKQWLIIAGKLSTSVASSFLFGCGRAVDGAAASNFSVGSGTSLEFAIRNSGAWKAYSVPIAHTPDLSFVAGYALDDAGVLSLFWNGRMVGQQPGWGAAIPKPNVDPVGLMSYASANNTNLYGRSTHGCLIAFGNSGDVFRTAAELSKSPWKIFKPRPRRTIIDLGASGTSSVYSDSALTYYIRSLLSSDSGIQYAIRNAIYKDDAVGYYLRSAISQNNEVGYVLRSAIAKDDAEAYKIRGLVQSSDAETYSIRGLVQTSDGEAYKIRSQVQADASTSYDIQSSTSVASSNAVNYSVRGVVAASVLVGYSVRGSAQRDAASAYSVRSAVSRDVVASYSVSAAASSVYADSTASYSVDGVVPSGPSAESIAAAVLAALQGTTIPANIKQVNDVTVQGAGTKLNPWQPV